ncbi:MAG: nucleotidyltransferase family protein [Prevotella sp.]|nr:nucleotidyltransferase family protein [Prevotella sp.]
MVANALLYTIIECIKLIQTHADELRSDFGIHSLRLFGSVSRGEQHENSDVDVCVEMAPNIYMVVRLKRYLEQLLQCPVDVVHMHPHMNPYLLNDIERDGIYVIQ